MAINSDRFFKVLMPGFSDKLSLPSEFTKTISKDIHQTATIRGPLGKWNVKIQGDAKKLYFTEGWREFTQAHDLSVGFFLLFEHKGNMVFSVKVLDHSECEKIYNPARPRCSECEALGKKTSQLNMEYSRKDPTRKDVQEALRPSFKATMNPRSIMNNYLYVPNEFKTACNISGKNQLVLRDTKGRHWTVKLHHRQVGPYHRAEFSHGWRDFCLNNKLEEGDVCIFELASRENTDVVVDVNIFSKRGKQG